MPNDTTGLFQSLIAANNAAAAALKYQNTFVDSIFWDNRPVAQTPFTKLTVIVPSVDESDVVDIGAGPVQPTDTAHSTFEVPFDRNFSTSFVIKEWEQGRTPVELQRKYTQPRLEAFLRKVNRTISQHFNSTTFNIHSVVNGGGADKFERKDITDAWVNLAKVGAPMEDNGNMFLATTPQAYGNMLSDSNFITQSIVGDSAAVEAQQRAHLRLMYGAGLRYDQHLAPFEAGKEPGALYHRYCMAGLTAPVKSQAGDGGNNVQEAVIRIKGLPVRMQVWYSPDDQGTKVHYNAWWGVAPARKELCSLLQTA